MVSNLGEPQVSQVIQSIADGMFETLAERFPVCSASDEFHYFPQTQPPQCDWFVWDDFSPETVEQVARKLSIWEEALTRLPGNHLDQNALIDVSMIRRVASTLREELTEVRFQQTQPTFYLTIAGIGLAEVLDHDQIAWENRVRGLPRFLDRARMNLDCIPTLFRDLGLEMARDTKAWLASIGGSRSGLGPVLSALERFEDHLRIVSTRESFLLAPELLERIISHHVGCAMEIQEIREELNQEIVEMEKIMHKESQRVNPGRSWQEAVESIPLPPQPEDGLLGLYRNAVLDAGEHCLQQGLITHDLFHACPVRVEPTPVYLSAVRSAAGYSMPPGHPPSGGTFFIVDLDVPNDQRQLLHRDCRMVAAHETYPGHHLLDASRWNLGRVMRRPIEFPLFYEGWACFAEELMSHTGYFQAPPDSLLLARRHFWRAIRGKVDLEIQAGKMDLQAAASCFTLAGMNEDRALSAVRRYALKPGYQLCYTMGLRPFRRLYERFGGDRPRDFAVKVLALGQIGLDNLEEALTP